MTTQPQPPKKNSLVYDWIKAYQENADQHVQTQLVKHYRGLVESLARKYSKGKSIHEDLVQVGMIGLLAAIRRYDENYGKSFESFAVPTILGEIKRFIRDKTWSVHVPRRVKELGPRINQTVDILTNQLQRSPQISEIAEYLEITEEEVLETLEMNNGYRAVSIDTQFESDTDGNKGFSIVEMIGQEEAGYTEIDRLLLIEKVFHVLTDREREILNYTFYQNMSQKEAGEKVGISQMHVSRIQRRALQKMREALRIDI